MFWKRKNEHRNERKNLEFDKAMSDFLDIKGFFKRTNTNSGSSWKIGPLGKLIRQNLLRWWWEKTVNGLSNVVGIEEISTDNNFYERYKEIAEENNLSVPFGVSRVKKESREHFRNNTFIFSDTESRQFIMDFFVFPENSSGWLDTWKEYIMENLESIGIYSTSVEIIKERLSDVEPGKDYFYERILFKYLYPFGSEAIISISNVLDYKFEGITDFLKSDKLKLVVKNKPVFPHLIKIKIDVEKLVLSLLMDRYTSSSFNSQRNISVVLEPKIAPIKCCIFPEEASEKLKNASQEICDLIGNKYKIVYEENGSTGERLSHYREFGVPFFVLVNDEGVRKGKYQVFDVMSEKWMELKPSEIFGYIRERVRA